jgi:hypothetical protein
MISRSSAFELRRLLYMSSFGIKPRALWGALKHAGMSLTDSGRTDTLVRIEGKPKRLVQIQRVVLHKEDK